VPKYETQFVVVPSECKMALKRGLQDEDIAQELILDSDSDAHMSEDDISSQSDSDTEDDDRKDRLQRLDRHYTNSTFCTCDTQDYRGAQWAETK
jgi:hypothetical protein